MYVQNLNNCPAKKRIEVQIIILKYITSFSVCGYESVTEAALASTSIQTMHALHYMSFLDHLVMFGFAGTAEKSVQSKCMSTLIH